MSNKSSIQKVINDLKDLEDMQCFYSSSERKRFSRDFFDYSPVLIKRLSNCCADFVVRPGSVESVLAVASSCSRNNVPLTLRGSGTGNYGQCVPLEGGVVMQMMGLRNIRHFDPETGEVTVEAGCLLGDLEKSLIEQGRQLRLLPSTWRSSSVGGFFAGGSGGIGSVRWGFLRDPGHLLGLEVVTVENSPKKVWLDGEEAQAINHAYGTNGIITAIKLATTSFINWQAVSVDCEDWGQAVELLISFSRAAVDLYLCSLLEKEIVDQIPNTCGTSNGSHRLLVLVAPDGVSTLQRLSKDAGTSFNLLGSENDVQGRGLRELTWNHTTLHMRAIDSSWTYLQMLLPQPEIYAIDLLKNKWGNDLLWHLEAVRQQGVQRIAALPIIRWKGEHSLQELMDDCRNLGAVIFNPHVITVEEGGLGVVNANQVNAKKENDPKGILNPGKLRGWLEK